MIGGLSGTVQAENIPPNFPECHLAGLSPEYIQQEQRAAVAEYFFCIKEKNKNKCFLSKANYVFFDLLQKLQESGLSNFIQCNQKENKKNPREKKSYGTKLAQE